jgi:hypothetical protein
MSDLLQYTGVGSLAIGVLLSMYIYLVCSRLSASRRPAPRSPDEPLLPPDPLSQIGNDDQRQASRRHVKQVAVLIADAERKGSPCRGIVLDRSGGGLRLAVENPFAVGTILQVRPTHVADLIPWVQMEVKNCASAQSGWEIGCQFSRTPPSTVLWLFG